MISPTTTGSAQHSEEPAAEPGSDEDDDELDEDDGEHLGYFEKMTRLTPGADATRLTGK